MDNSADPGVFSSLRALLPSSTLLIHVSNCGYAAAVNSGIRYLADNFSVPPELILVSTHESVPENGAIACLAEAVSSSDEISAAGPTLLTRNSRNEPRVWSTGGYLTSALRLPRHKSHDDHPASLEAASREPVDRQWLDGAFIVYRFRDLHEHPMPEHYFLYMEEVDLHLSLRGMGRRVVWAPGASVWQSSKGIPDFYLGRNLQLLQNRHGTIVSQSLSTPWELLRRTASGILHSSSPMPSWRQFLRGYISGRQLLSVSRRRSRPHVAILNPLGAALRHYTRALESELQMASAAVMVDSILEPSSAPYGRIGWLVRFYLHIALLRTTRPERIIVTWPPLGMIDVLLLRAIGGPYAYIVVHDPIPLVRAIGYNRVVGRSLRLVPSAQTIVHSQPAADALKDLTGITPDMLRHPMIWTADSQACVSSPNPVPTVLVFGQFKPDRDTQLLSALGKRLAGRYGLKIVGRGWQQMENWAVTDCFIPEPEVEQLLLSATVVLIPYTRYFQSGVATRCVELGVPVVGSRTQSLEDLLGIDSGLLVKNPESVDDWVRSIEHACLYGVRAIRERSAYLKKDNSSQWRRWLTGDTSGED